MRLTRSSCYALQALAHLAAAGPDRPVVSHHIARARGISETFLRKVLRPLVAAKVLRSAPGGATAWPGRPHGSPCWRSSRPWKVPSVAKRRS